MSAGMGANCAGGFSQKPENRWQAFRNDLALYLAPLKYEQEIAMANWSSSSQKTGAQKNKNPLNETHQNTA